MSGVLEVKGIWKSFGRGAKRVRAVQGVTLAIQPGEILALLGPNGAGKTTTIKMIAGIVRPDEGSVEVGGMDPHRQPGRALGSIGAVLEGNRNVYWRLTAIENLVYFGVLKGLTRAEARSRGGDLLALLGLADKRHETVQKLSRGMQQKLAIACALVHRPALLLLDEPTLGLDVEAAETVKEWVRRIARDQGAAVLLTTHQMDVAEEISDRVAFIRAGRIILEDRTRNLLAAFSIRAYTFEVAEPLGDVRIDQLVRLGATVEQNGSGAIVRLASPDSASFYEVVEILRPVDLAHVQRDTVDLLEVFKRVVHNGEAAR